MVLVPGAPRRAGLDLHARARHGDGVGVQPRGGPAVVPGLRFTAFLTGQSQIHPPSILVTHTLDARTKGP